MCVFCGPALMNCMLTWTPTSHCHRHHCREPFGPRTRQSVVLALGQCHEVYVLLRDVTQSAKASMKSKSSLGSGSRNGGTGLWA